MHTDNTITKLQNLKYKNITTTSKLTLKTKNPNYKTLKTQKKKFSPTNKPNKTNQQKNIYIPNHN